ncbi:hypothetical protein EXS56_02460 [Candidatus Kaiserbacteria bacterium]|nr:hypothetical protein [Candidatus Kaiserbacteria bacterium]
MVKKSGKGGITNEKIMEVLLDMSKKVDTMDALIEIQARQSGHIQSAVAALGSKVKRFEAQVDKYFSGFGERMNEMEGALKGVVEWGATKADLKEFATKDDLERMKEEILEPVIKAVDKDAEAIFNHGKRITVLERRAGVAAK